MFNLIKFYLNLLGILLLDGTSALATEQYSILPPTATNQTDIIYHLTPCQENIAAKDYKSTYSVLLEDGSQIDFVPKQGLFWLSPDNKFFIIHGTYRGTNFNHLTLETIQTILFNAKQPIFDMNLVVGIHHEETSIPYVFPDQHRETTLRKYKDAHPPQMDNETWQGRFATYLYHTSFFPTSGCQIL